MKGDLYVFVQFIVQILQSGSTSSPGPSPLSKFTPAILKAEMALGTRLNPVPCNYPLALSEAKIA